MKKGKLFLHILLGLSLSSAFGTSLGEAIDPGDVSGNVGADSMLSAGTYNIVGDVIQNSGLGIFFPAQANKLTVNYSGAQTITSTTSSFGNIIGMAGDASLSVNGTTGTLNLTSTSNTSGNTASALNHKGSGTVDINIGTANLIYSGSGTGNSVLCNDAGSTTLTAHNTLNITNNGTGAMGTAVDVRGGSVTLNATKADITTEGASITNATGIQNIASLKLMGLDSSHLGNYTITATGAGAAGVATGLLNTGYFFGGDLTSSSNLNNLTVKASGAGSVTGVNTSGGIFLANTIDEFKATATSTDNQGTALITSGTGSNAFRTQGNKFTLEASSNVRNIAQNISAWNNTGVAKVSNDNVSITNTNTNTMFGMAKGVHNENSLTFNNKDFQVSAKALGATRGLDNSNNGTITLNTVTGKISVTSNNATGQTENNNGIYNEGKFTLNNSGKFVVEATNIATNPTVYNELHGIYNTGTFEDTGSGELLIDSSSVSTNATNEGITNALGGTMDLKQTTFKVSGSYGKGSALNNGGTLKAHDTIDITGTSDNAGADLTGIINTGNYTEDNLYTFITLNGSGTSTGINNSGTATLAGYGMSIRVTGNDKSTTLTGIKNTAGSLVNNNYARNIINVTGGSGDVVRGIETSGGTVDFTPSSGDGLITTITTTTTGNGSKGVDVYVTGGTTTLGGNTLNLTTNKTDTSKAANANVYIKGGGTKGILNLNATNNYLTSTDGQGIHAAGNNTVNINGDNTVIDVVTNNLYNGFIGTGGDDSYAVGILFEKHTVNNTLNVTGGNLSVIVSNHVNDYSNRAFAINSEDSGSRININNNNVYFKTSAIGVSQTMATNSYADIVTNSFTIDSQTLPGENVVKRALGIIDWGYINITAQDITIDAKAIGGGAAYGIWSLGGTQNTGDKSTYTTDVLNVTAIAGSLQNDNFGGNVNAAAITSANKDITYNVGTANIKADSLVAGADTAAIYLYDGGGTSNKTLEFNGSNINLEAVESKTDHNYIIYNAVEGGVLAVNRADATGLSIWKGNIYNPFNTSTLIANMRGAGSTFTGWALSEAGLTLGLSDKSLWNYKTRQDGKNNHVNNFNFSDSTVDMTYSEGYQTLHVDNLKGNNGTFEMETDLQASHDAMDVQVNSDKLLITDATSQGHYIISIKDASLRTLKNAQGYVLVVSDTTTDRGTTFEGKDLQNGGLFIYTPQLTDADPDSSLGYGNILNGDVAHRNWYITSVPKTGLSNNGKVNMGFGATRYGVYRGIVEDDTLLKRLGELRDNPNQEGMWARIKASSNEYGQSYVIENKQRTYQLGYDKLYHTNKDQDKSYLGIAYGHTTIEDSYSLNARGEGSEDALTVYNTWLGKKGHYFDLVGKVGKWRADYDYTGDYNERAETGSWFYTLSGEYGRKIINNKGYYVEPQVQLTLGRLNSADYVSTQENNGHMDTVSSTVVRTGFVAGRNFAPQAKAGNYYAKIFWNHEFGGSTNLTVHDKNDEVLRDTGYWGHSWWTAGIGLNANIDAKTNSYLDLEKTFGSNYRSKWRVNAGVRWEF